MPDILIRGMEMPESCADCPICYDMMECSVSPLRFWNGRTELEQFEFCNERHPSCPLIELPPHGDLIFRDEAVSVLQNIGSRDYRREKGTICDAIKMISHERYVPAIVPASEEDTNG